LGYDYRRSHLCTVRSARYTFPGFKSYSLDKITANLGIVLNGHHRAKNDALATSKLLDKIIEANEGNLDRYVQKEINPKELHPLLDAGAIDAIQNQTGIYKFYDETGKLIYIGKSKAVKSRIQQHLKNNTSKKAIAMKQEIARIDPEYTGSELIALLLESKLIKQHKPHYNRALRKDKLNYGVYDYEDGKGYLNLVIERVNKMQAQPLITFETRTEATGYLTNLVVRQSLCQKLTGLYQSSHSCFQYQTKECRGACVAEESPQEYNSRIQHWIDRLNFENKSFYIIEKGRSKHEKSIVFIENGVYRGFGFIPVQAMKLPRPEWSEFVTIYNEDRDSRMIIKSYLNRNEDVQVCEIEI
jgi:DNA polymerase III subunit epsilon